MKKRSLFQEPRDACVAEAAHSRTVGIPQQFQVPMPSVSKRMEAKSPKLKATESVDSLLEELYYSLDYDKGEYECGSKREAKRAMRREDSGKSALFCPKQKTCFVAEDSMLSPKIEEMSSNEVFICNLKYSTTKAQLQAFFSRCGAVANITLPLDRRSSKSKGYAFIAFERDESVQRAIAEMNGAYLNGRPLSVRCNTKWPSPRSKRSSRTKSAIGSALKFPSAATVPMPISAAPGRYSIATQTSTRKLATAVGERLTVFVGNVPFHAKRGLIRDLFSEACGNPVDAVRLVTSSSGKARGFGYVDFYTKEDARRALSLNGHVICGRVLRVNYADGYRPDYCKKKEPRIAAAVDPLYALSTTTDLQPPFAAADALSTAAYVPVIGERYLPLVQVPRGYALALVPMASVSLPMASMRDAVHMSQPQYSSLQSATRTSHAWRVPDMVPLADASAAFGYCARRPQTQAPGYYYPAF